MEGSDKEKVITEWSVHRVRQEPRKLVILIVLLLLSNAFLLLVFPEIYRSFPFLILLGNVMLLGSVSDYLFPVRFTLTEEGAAYRNLLFKKRISWSNVRNCYLSETGIKLSPLEKRSRLENFRGFVLLFNNNREEVIDHVRRHAVNRQR